MLGITGSLLTGTPMLTSLDRFFTEPLSMLRPLEMGSVLRPAVDLYDSGDHLVVRALIPGATAEDFEIVLDQDVLTISGHFGLSVDENETEQATWYRREIGTGRFSERIRLPAAVDGDHVESTFANGVLTLRMPKTTEARARRIAVQPAEPARAAQTS